MNGSESEARARAVNEQNILVQQLRDSGNEKEAERLQETYHAREMSGLAADVYKSAKHEGKPPVGEVTPESWTVGSNGRLGLFPVLYRAQALQFQSDALLVVVLDVLHEPSLQTLDAVKAVQVEKF